MPVTQLATFAPQTQTIPVGGANYTVNSKVEWVRDDTGGTASCTSDKRDADYLHITTTVTSSIVGTRVKAVQLDSLIAPDIQYSTTHGTLGVLLTDRTGSPLVNKLVSITGTTAGTDSGTGQTNTAGCALFQNIGAGTYTITLNTPGLVDHAGKTNVSIPDTSVPAGSLTLVSKQYDVPGSISATIKTYKPGSTASTAQIPSVATKISATNGLDTSVLVTFASAASSSFSGSGLFPYLNSTYGFFTGGCRYSDPSRPGYTPGYFTSVNNGSAQVNPGANTAITILQPAFNLRVMKRSNGSTTIPNGMIVVAKPNPVPGDSCAEAQQTLNTFTTTGTGGSTGVVGRSQTTDTTYVEAGAPFGNYDICVQDTVSSVTKHWTYPDDLAPAGLAPYDMSKLSSTGTQTTSFIARSGLPAASFARSPGPRSPC